MDSVTTPATPHEMNLASMSAAALTIALGWLGANGLEDYGGVLFLGLPTLCGFMAGLFLSLRHPRSTTDCVLAAGYAVLGVGAGVLLFAMEGFVCLLMVAPIALPLALLGGALASSVQRCRRLRSQTPAVLLAVLLSAPLLLGVEAAVDPEPPLLKVRSEVVVNAPPEVVWPRVISFPELPEEREWLFRTGIAYPLRAEIRGSGPGALRFCVFSTGAFVEPVEVWNEPRLLRFAITQSPPSLRELSPWGDIRPPHTDSSFQGEMGQFELRPLPGGRTLLVGTTWYRQDLRPVLYWRLWSDAIVHRIHLRVLRHIARLAEEDVRAGRGSG